MATQNDLSLLRDLSISTFQATFGEQNTPEDMDSYVTENFSEEQLGREISDPLATFLIAEQPGKAVGYAKLQAGNPAGCVTGREPIELVRLYVVSESIGGGIGSRLMQEAIDRAASQGYKTLWLGVWEHNPRAQRFYQRWGFEHVGSHIFQLGSDAQTDLILQKHLFAHSPE